MKRLNCHNLHRVNTEMMLLKCPNTCMKRSICRQSFTRWLDPPSYYVRRKCYPPNNAQNLSCIQKHMHIYNYIGWTLVHHMTHSRKHFTKYLKSQIMEYACLSSWNIYVCVYHIFLVQQISTDIKLCNALQISACRKTGRYVQFGAKGGELILTTTILM